MVYRKGISAIVFRRKGKKARFLLLHRTQNWTGYEFLKGGRKGSEKEESCLKREVREETGIKKYLSVRTAYSYRYPWPKWFVKDNCRFSGAHFQLFVVEDLEKTDRIRIDRHEHSGYLWTDGRKALRLITHSDQRRAMRFVLSHYF
jgi:8-oxo-dGTP pyrophosphatase MutT (NUDIX family)